MFTKFRILGLLIALVSAIGLIVACSDSKSRGSTTPPASFDKNYIGVRAFDDYAIAINYEAS